ncbi:MAG TPA: YtxH domain-containing protein [Terriglobia bacterium]|nr:YtxH domain-containing protein [Terriglobia bacterium]
MNKITTKIAFFVAGAGVGAVIAALYTPKSGKETRRMISKKAEEGMDYLETRSKELRHQAEDAVDRSREFVNRQKDRLAEVLKAS